MAKMQVKVEKLSDDEEETIIKEEKLFLETPIKIEYSSEPFECKESTNLKGSDLISLSHNIGFDCPVKQEKSEDNQPSLKEEPLPIDTLSTSNHTENLLGSQPGSSIHGMCESAISGNEEGSIQASPGKVNSTYSRGREGRSCIRRDNFSEHRNLTSYQPAIISRSTSYQPANVSKSRPTFHRFIEPSSSYSDRSNTNDECDKNIDLFSEGRVDDYVVKLTDDGDISYVEERQYPCFKCREVFTDEASLASHQSSHSRALVMCVKCKAPFPDVHLLRIHLRVHHKFDVFVCGCCDESFPDEKSLHNHFRTPDGNKPRYCGMGFLRRGESVPAPEEVQEEGKLFQCAECKAKFKLKTSLLRHERTNMCKRKSPDQLGLEHRLLARTSINRFQCDRCEAQFFTVSNLKRHQSRAHSVEKAFDREDSEHEYVLPHELDRHQLVDTEEFESKDGVLSGSPLNCCEVSLSEGKILEGVKVKDEQVSIETSLDSHGSASSEEKTLGGGDSKKRFANNTVLGRHPRLHSSVKAFGCGRCKKRFSKKNLLDRHQSVQCIEKLFKFGKGKKGIKQRPKLKKHQLVVNSEDKPFDRAKCGQALSQKELIDSHQHTGKKAFKEGGLCEETFSSQPSFYGHERMHPRKTLPFVCSECNAEFSHRISLRRHESVHLAKKNLKLKERKRRLPKKNIGDISQETLRSSVKHVQQSGLAPLKVYNNPKNTCDKSKT